MRIWKAGRVSRIMAAAMALAVAFLAGGAAMASDVERQVPVIRDTAGSGLTTEISREGTRQTATPYLTLHDPTVRRIEDRIGRKIARLTAKEALPEANATGTFPRIDLTGTPREDSGRPETTLSSLPSLPGEITIRNVKHFLKGLRASRKEKPAPAVSVPVPELRLGMADTSPR